jgi:drug/metabolite transporter (DMT)-like permease
MVLSLALASLAAVANAGSNVLQREASRREPSELSLSPRLTWQLLHNKQWLVAFSLVIASFLLQATALGTGELAVVQPVIVLELPLTLIAAGLFFRAHLGGREWLAIVLLTAGLAGLVGFLHPEGGRSSAGTLAWSLGGGLSFLAMTLLVVEGRARRANARGALYGVAAGIAFGLTASFMKAMTGAFSQGMGHLFASWSLYAMAVTGILGMFLVQNALQAGRLVAAQPGISLMDPFTSVAWGVLAFGERTNGGFYIGLAVISGAALAAGALLLSSSPALNPRLAGGSQSGSQSGSLREDQERGAPEPARLRP